MARAVRWLALAALVAGAIMCRNDTGSSREAHDLRIEMTVNNMLSVMRAMGSAAIRSKPPTEDDLIDAWGTAMQMDVRSEGVTIRSAGADRVWKTSDDLIVVSKR
jgi:hypothetical protein